MDKNASTTSSNVSANLDPNVATAAVGCEELLKAGDLQECGCTRYGKCKWFNVAKGWGFITPTDGGQEVFVHQSVIQMSGFRSLGEQEEVEFECKETARGLEATRVSGRHGNDCHGSTFRPRKNTKKRYRRIRCYNCGAFANHTAAECTLGQQPKRCYHCHSEDHLLADCPNRKHNTQTSGSINSQRRSRQQPAAVHSQCSIAGKSSDTIIQTT